MVSSEFESLRSKLHAATAERGVTRSESPVETTPSGVVPGHAAFDTPPPDSQSAELTGPRVRKRSARGEWYDQDRSSRSRSRPRSGASAEPRPKPPKRARRGRSGSRQPRNKSKSRPSSEDTHHTSAPRGRPTNFRVLGGSKPPKSNFASTIRIIESNAPQEAQRQARRRDLKRIIRSPTPGSTDGEQGPDPEANGPSKSPWEHIFKTQGFKALVEYAKEQVNQDLSEWSAEDIIETLNVTVADQTPAVADPRLNSSIVMLAPEAVGVGGGWHCRGELTPAAPGVLRLDQGNRNLASVPDANDTDTQTESEDEEMVDPTDRAVQTGPSADDLDTAFRNALPPIETLGRSTCSPAPVRAELSLPPIETLGPNTRSPTPIHTESFPPIETLGRHETAATVLEFPANGRPTSSQSIGGTLFTSPGPRLPMMMPTGPVRKYTRTVPHDHETLRTLAGDADPGLGDAEIGDAEEEGDEVGGPDGHEWEPVDLTQGTSRASSQRTYVGTRSHLNSNDHMDCSPSRADPRTPSGPPFQHDAPRSILQNWPKSASGLAGVRAETADKVARAQAVSNSRLVGRGAGILNTPKPPTTQLPAAPDQTSDTRITRPQAANPRTIDPRPANSRPANPRPADPRPTGTRSAGSRTSASRTSNDRAGGNVGGGKSNAKAAPARRDAVAHAQIDTTEFNVRQARNGNKSLASEMRRQTARQARCDLPGDRCEDELMADNEEDLTHAEALSKGNLPARGGKKKPLARDSTGTARHVLTAAKVLFFVVALIECIYQVRATFMIWAGVVHESTWARLYPSLPYVAALESELEVIVNNMATMRGKVKDRIRPIIEYYYGFRPRVASEEDIQYNKDIYNDIHPNSFHCTGYRPRTGHYESNVLARCIAAALFYGPNSPGFLFAEYFEEMPLTVVAFILAVMQFCIEEWVDGYWVSRDLGAAHMLEKYEMHLEGLKRLLRLAPRRMARMQDYWTSYALDYAGASVVRQQTHQGALLDSEMRPDTPPPVDDSSCEEPPVASSSGQGNATSSSNRRRSPSPSPPPDIWDAVDEHLANHSGALIIHDNPRPTVPTRSRAQSPDLPIEYNEHGNRTGRSLGKNRAD